MVWVIARNELHRQLLSFRFAISFLLCAVLLVISLLVRVNAYQQESQALAPLLEPDGYRRAAESHWDMARLAGGPTPVSRLLPRLKVLCTGVGDALSLRAVVRGYEGPIYQREPFITNPVPLLFSSLDFVFIVNVVVSLIAVLLTYDSIAGEKEAGTLRLTMANSIARGQLITGKWLGLYGSFLLGYVPCLVIGATILAGHPGIELQNQDWFAAAMIALASLILAASMFALGILVSSLTREPRAALISLLAVWTVLALVIPNFSPYLAGKLVRVPPSYQVESQVNRVRYEAAATAWERVLESLRPDGLHTTSTDDWQGLHQGTWPDGLRRLMRNLPDDAVRDRLDRLSASIAIDELTMVREGASAVRQPYSNQLARRRAVGKYVSMLSPNALFHYMASDLAQTGVQSEQRFRQAANQFHQDYVQFILQNMRRAGQLLAQPDVSDLPVFPYSEPSITVILEENLILLLLLVVYTALLLIGAHQAFVRYDVR